MRSDTYQPAREAMTALGATSTEDNNEVISTADVVIIAVKPNHVQAVLTSVTASFESKSSKTLVVSIAAGVTIESLESWLPVGTKVVRVMPNTPCLVKEVAAAAAKGTYCDDADLEVESLCTLHTT